MPDIGRPNSLAAPRRFQPLSAAFAGFLAFLLAACGGGGGGSSSPAPTPTPTPTLAALALAPQAPSLAPGATRQMTATGTYSDGTSKDISATVTWTSSSPTVASVSNTGLVGAIAAGSSTISAASGGLTASTVATVTSPSVTLTGLTLSPLTPSITKGATRQLTATGAYSDGTSRDLSTSATWSSSNPAVASVSSSGLVTGVAAGTATVTATSGGTNASTVVTITAATLSSMTVSPANANVVKGGTKAFTATGTFSDGTTGPVAVTWSSSAPAVATINASGLATALAAGTTTITATAGSMSASATLVVSGATLVAIGITPVNPSVVAGQSILLSATGIYSDGSTANLPNSPTWASGSTATATVNSAGYVTGVAAGSTTITATSGGVTSTTPLTVTAPVTPTAVTVSPASATLALGATQGFQAIVTFSNGTSLNMTLDVVWSSTNTGVATVDKEGLTTALSSGTTSIRATYGSVAGQATLTVSAPTLTGVNVTPGTATLSVGGTVDLTAEAIFSNGTGSSPYDNQVTWTSSSTAVATVNAGGVVTAIGAGTATIRATGANGVYGQATITVNGPTFDPALVGTWEYISFPDANLSNFGSFYTFYANGTFTYTLIFDNGNNPCVTTKYRVAFHSGTFTSSAGKIYLHCTTLYDDITACNGTVTRYPKSTPTTQVHDASFQNGYLYTNNTNDFINTGWLPHTKK